MCQPSARFWATIQRPNKPFLRLSKHYEAPQGYHSGRGRELGVDLGTLQAPDQTCHAKLPTIGIPG